MSTVLEIESAIRSLPKSDFLQLAGWIDELRAGHWDEQIEHDAKTGGLDFLFQEAEEARKNGQMKPWPAES